MCSRGVLPAAAQRHVSTHHCVFSKPPNYKSRQLQYEQKGINITTPGELDLIFFGPEERPRKFRIRVPKSSKKSQGKNFEGIAVSPSQNIVKTQIFGSPLPLNIKKKIQQEANKTFYRTKEGAKPVVVVGGGLPNSGNNEFSRPPVDEKPRGGVAKG